jgi:hypothetical protein
MKKHLRHLLQDSAILPPHISLFDFCKSDLFAKMNPRAKCWDRWNILFKILSGFSVGSGKDQISKKELEFFHTVSGGLRYRPGKMPQNLLLIIGRKGGKSTTISRIALYHSLRFNPSEQMVIDGEEPMCLIICPNLKTSLIDINFASGMMRGNEVLAEKIVDETQTKDDAELILANKTTIALRAVTGVTGRGPSTYCLILDEAAFFKKRGQFCDSQIFDDVEGGMARFGEDAHYFILTSPGRKQGLVWDRYQKYFGVENDEVLVIQGASKDIVYEGKQYYGFNPRLSDKWLKQKLESKGESWFRREILGEFVDAIEAAYSEQSVNKCAIRNISTDSNENYGLVDPAGLSPESINGDTFTAGVCHNERRKDKIVTVVPVIAGWNPNPESKRRVTDPRIAIKESIDLFRRHRVREICCDKYKVEWVRRDYVEAGFEVIDAPPKNQLYLDLEPMLNSGTIEYPADPILVQQLKSLERTAGRGEKDRIDHAREDHEDYANIVALGGYIGRLKVHPNVSMKDVKVGGARTIEREVFAGQSVVYDFKEEMM